MNYPWFPWYPKDCDTDENVRLMDDRELGFFMRCLNHSWINGSLPEDIGEIARLMKASNAYVAKLWVRVGPCWSKHHTLVGRIVNEKQEQFRKERAEVSTIKNQAARVRWDKQKQCTSNAYASPVQCQSQSQSQSDKDKPLNPLPGDVFKPSEPQRGDTPTVRAFREVKSNTAEDLFGDETTADSPGLVRSDIPTKKKTRKSRKPEAMSNEQRGRFREFLAIHPKRNVQTASAEKLWTTRVQEDALAQWLIATLRMECAGDATYLLGPWKWLEDHLSLYANGITGNHVTQRREVLPMVKMQ